MWGERPRASAWPRAKRHRFRQPTTERDPYEAEVELDRGRHRPGLAGTAMAEDLVVKIGHVGPTSGAIAHLGKDNENGARMAIDELNAKGVTIGGKKAKFELLAEDDAGDPKQGTAAAQKLWTPRSTA
jgi:ABC-type branched-subunit amino acid transport system substrate-binding protein